mmetsp:Transcript_83048/g.173858  ORF Transcript_83048/g.173858 Transcript_83048/m.173858 type:complete len:206 (-) Transcript_83048:191-808(-)
MMPASSPTISKTSASAAECISSKWWKTSLTPPKTKARGQPSGLEDIEVTACRSLGIGISESGVREAARQVSDRVLINVAPLGRCGESRLPPSTTMLLPTSVAVCPQTRNNSRVSEDEYNFFVASASHRSEEGRQEGSLAAFLSNFLQTLAFARSSLPSELMRFRSNLEAEMWSLVKDAPTVATLKHVQNWGPSACSEFFEALEVQ